MTFLFSLIYLNTHLQLSTGLGLVVSIFKLAALGTLGRCIYKLHFRHRALDWLDHFLMVELLLAPLILVGWIGADHYKASRNIYSFCFSTHGDPSYRELLNGEAMRYCDRQLYYWTYDPNPDGGLSRPIPNDNDGKGLPSPPPGWQWIILI